MKPVPPSSLPRRSMGAMTSTQFRLLKRLNK